eukprot:TRINITY_DN1446_c0_g2_i2.p1 TRINITY_DN1446_c0_g2~~TRINITY_DN1446_c0_g2_i2.p1  ORF type:complete len:273 (-),score=20.25 TRINITY_DN1446_c0_g2_i2:49-867(-)
MIVNLTSWLLCHKASRSLPGLSFSSRRLSAMARSGTKTVCFSQSAPTRALRGELRNFTTGMSCARTGHLGSQPSRTERLVWEFSSRLRFRCHQDRCQPDRGAQAGNLGYHRLSEFELSLQRPAGRRLSERVFASIVGLNSFLKKTCHIHFVFGMVVNSIVVDAERPLMYMVSRPTPSDLTRRPEPSAGAGNVLALSQGSGAAAAVALPMSVPPQNAGHAAGLSVPATKDDQTSLMGLTMASDNDEDLIAWSKMLMPESCTPEVGLASFMPSL